MVHEITDSVGAGLYSCKGCHSALLLVSRNRDTAVARLECPTTDEEGYICGSALHPLGERQIRTFIDSLCASRLRDANIKARVDGDDIDQVMQQIV